LSDVEAARSTPPDEDAFAPAAAAGIHRLSIPTPFAVGRVNVYVIEDEPLTLVDTGPNSGSSLDELERGLGALGHSIADLELVILTHQHIDHLGLVDVIRRRSGAEVATSEVARPYVERYSEEAAADDAFAVELMRRHGIPAETARALQSVSQAFRAWARRRRWTACCATASRSRCATGRSRWATAPVTPLPTRSSTTPRGAS